MAIAWVHPEYGMSPIKTWKCYSFCMALKLQCAAVVVAYISAGSLHYSTTWAHRYNLELELSMAAAGWIVLMSNVAGVSYRAKKEY